MSLKADGHPYLNEVIAGVLKYRYGYHVYSIAQTEEMYRFTCQTHVGRILFSLWEDVELLRLADRNRERLVKGRFRQLDRFIPGMDGQRYYIEKVNGEVLGCAVTDYFEPVNCRSRMKDIGHTMAKMHTAMKNQLDLERPSLTVPKWVDKFQLQIDQFIQARKSIEKRFMKTKTDKLFLLNFYSIMQRARKALKILSETDYESRITEFEQRAYWCHGHLHHKNIVSAGQVYISGLTEGQPDLPHYDIAFFLQSLAEDGELHEREVIAFFEGYNDVYPLKADDIKIVYSYVLFPHAVWRSIYSLYLAKGDSQPEEEEEREMILESFLKCLFTQKRIERLFPVMASFIYSLVEEEERKEGNHDA